MLFVGEKRSKLAKKMKVTWKDGRLAAKQLFDALKYCGIDPKDVEFRNYFEKGGPAFVKSYNGPIIAMGDKVSKALTMAGIEHYFIYHPAARGTIRKKEIYCEHVKTNLADLL